MKCIKIEQKGPHVSFLEEYRCLSDNESLFTETDYLFLCNANMLFVDKVDDGILPKEPPFLIGVQLSDLDVGHQKEDNRDKSNPHYADTFIGGKKNNFFQMVKTIREQVDSNLGDKNKDAWEIGDYINAYYAERHPKSLHPGYSFPGLSKLPYPKKIVAIQKRYMAIKIPDNE